ncbi:MAG TPA: hypothetical protein VMH41_12820 [Mycobacteriales bacterium]|nr:hypothetical protein [Mycobacteriales bacterium]
MTITTVTPLLAGRLLADDNGPLGAGFIAFLVVLALAIASFFLFRSMSRHLRKVPGSFDPPPSAAPPPRTPEDE